MQAVTPNYNAYNTTPGSTLGTSGIGMGPASVNGSILPLPSNPPVSLGTPQPIVNISDWQPGKGIIDTSTIAGGVPSGTLDVGGKLTLDGGTFTNTGFVNANTIELDNVNLINAQRLAAVDYSNFTAFDNWSQTTGYAIQDGGVMNANNWIINDIQLDANGKALQPSITRPSADGDGITTAYYSPDERTGSISCVGNCTFGVTGGDAGQDIALKGTLAAASGVTYSSTALSDLLTTISQSPPLPWYETGAVGVVALIVTYIVNAFCDGCLTAFLMAEMHVSYAVAFAMATAISKGFIQIAAGANVEDTMVSTLLSLATTEMMAVANNTIPMPTGSGFGSVLARNVIQGGIGAIFVSHSMNLDNLLGSAFTNTLMQMGANQIGAWAKDGTSTTAPTINPFEQLLLHAGLGCVGGAATAGNMSGCAPGAAGGFAGEWAAQTYNPTATPDGGKTVSISSAVGTAAALVVSGGNMAAGDIGGITGANAAANNQMSGRYRFCVMGVCSPVIGGTSSSSSAGVEVNEDGVPVEPTLAQQADSLLNKAGSAMGAAANRVGSAASNLLSSAWNAVTGTDSSQPDGVTAASTPNATNGTGNQSAGRFPWISALFGSQGQQSNGTSFAGTPADTNNNTGNQNPGSVPGGAPPLTVTPSSGLSGSDGYPVYPPWHKSDTETLINQPGAVSGTTISPTPLQVGGSNLTISANGANSAGTSTAASGGAATGNPWSSSLSSTLNSIQAGGDNLLEVTVHTSAGDVNVLAEVSANGTQLQLKDFTIYGSNGQIPSGSIIKDVLAGKSDLIQAAGANGFTEINITGTRVPGSSSANPGKIINLTIPVK